MNTLDLSPLYRSSIGFDRFGSLLDSALRSEPSTGYPPYNIEVVDDNEYAITLAVAGFSETDIEIQTEQGVLTIKGKKESAQRQKQFLHQGIANRSFERKFNLADHVEVQSASLEQGLLTIQLIREIPEAMKPKTIAINGVSKLAHEEVSSDADAGTKDSNKSAAKRLNGKAA